MPLASDTPLTDDYIAKLLTQDALNASAGSSRRSALAPKPNTRFLRNILRDADGHNAALKRKEEHEAKERKRHLELDERRQSHRGLRDNGRLTPPADELDDIEVGPRMKRRRTDEEHRHERHHGKSRRHENHEARLRSHSRERRRHRHSQQDDRRDEKRSRRQREERVLRGRSDASPDRLQHRRHRREERWDTRNTSRDRRKQSSNPSTECRKSPRSSSPKPRRRQSSSASSDSDPLEALIGPVPLPPKENAAPIVRGRGRGTFASQSIDRHFKPGYDPAADLEHNSNATSDDWEEALEAIRDRQKWKQIGAQRLREAGFGEKEVKRWEKNKGPRADGEADVDDVRWTKRGEDREWDKGKVLDGNSIRAEASWGRLKDT